MRAGLKRAGRYIALAIAALVIAGIAAPFLSADRYGEEIRLALERGLGRKVDVKGKVAFDLFTGPGFTVEGVVIHEDPSIGIEPFAYVTSLEASPRLWSLWAGRLEFASIRLDDTSVNLAKTSSGRWNFEQFLRSPAIAGLPDLKLRGARVNFKSGDTKSVFYLTDTDMDVSPPAGATGGWRFRVSGQPARTDRAARGLGSIQARGRWTQQAGQPGRLDLDIELAKSQLGEIAALLQGYDVGVHGLVSSHAHLAGPASDVRIDGRLSFDDVHRWDQMPYRGGGFGIGYQGRLNLTGQAIELESKSGVPVAVRFRAADYFGGSPRWGVALNWNRFPIEPLLSLAAHMGVTVPADLECGGYVEGAIGYSGSLSSLEGQLALHDAVIRGPNTSPVRFEHARLMFDRGRVHLEPSLVRTQTEDQARIEAVYSWASQIFDLTITADAMKVEALQAQPRLTAVPGLEQMRGGTWSGQLRYRTGGDPAAGSEPGWSGHADLRQVEAALPELSEPLRIESAVMRIDGSRISLDHMRARAGKIRWHGEYLYQASAAHPHRFRIVLGDVDGTEVERILLPALDRRRSLFARALALGRTRVPQWLKELSAEGTVQASRLKIGEASVENFRGHLVWDGPEITLADLAANFMEGTVSGDLGVDLTAGVPQYRLTARLAGMDWSGGSGLDSELTVSATGTGRQLLASLRSEGTFSARSLEVEPLSQFDQIAGAFLLQWAEPAPKIRLTALQFSGGGETFQGDGSSQDDGRLLIQLTNGRRQLRMHGTLAQMRMDEAAVQ
jgi:AsmA family